MAGIMEARKEAFKLLNEKLTRFSQEHDTYSSIYVAATSNVKGTLKLYNDYDRVLTVGATGAHAYEAALNGAKKVDQFDINELQRLFYEYMKTAIIHLSYEDFIKHFTITSKVLHPKILKDFLSSELYYKLKPYLSEEVEMVFGQIFECMTGINLFNCNLFRIYYAFNLDYLKTFISFYNEEEFYKLKKILINEECKISYHTLSLREVPYKFEDKYDLILLDNIFQYYKNMPGFDSPSKVNMFIDKTLSNLLTEKGVIQTNYGFTIAAEALKKYLGMPTSKDRFFTNPSGQRELAIELKEGIDTQFIKRWNHYSYNFIDAVEKNEINTDNVVITYKPKRG